MGCGVPGKSDILVRLPAVHILVHCPVSGVGRLNGSLLVCLRKYLALVSHCVPSLGRETNGETGEGPLGWTAHFVCTVLRASWVGSAGTVLLLPGLGSGDERRDGRRTVWVDGTLRVHRLHVRWKRRGGSLASFGSLVVFAKKGGVFNVLPS